MNVGRDQNGDSPMATTPASFSQKLTFSIDSLVGDRSSSSVGNPFSESSPATDRSSSSPKRRKNGSGLVETDRKSFDGQPVSNAALTAGMRPSAFAPATTTSAGPGIDFGLGCAPGPIWQLGADGGGSAAVVAAAAAAAAAGLSNANPNANSAAAAVAAAAAAASNGLWKEALTASMLYNPAMFCYPWPQSQAAVELAKKQQEFLHQDQQARMTFRPAPSSHHPQVEPVDQTFWHQHIAELLRQNGGHNNLQHSRLYSAEAGHAGFLFAGCRKPKRIRTAFSPNQLMELEGVFEKNQYVVGNERKELARRLALTETQIKVWFQNRRTKQKRMKSEENPSSSPQTTSSSSKLETTSQTSRPNSPSVQADQLIQKLPYVSRLYPGNEQRSPLGYSDEQASDNDDDDDVEEEEAEADDDDDHMDGRSSSKMVQQSV